MNEATTARYPILICGLDPASREFIDHAVAVECLVEIPYDLERLAGVKMDPEPVVLIFGASPVDVKLLETAQVARMRYAHRPIFYVTSNREKFDRAEFRKNGFTDAFLIPSDTEVATLAIRDELARASQGTIRSYRPVCLVDLRPGETLDFDTFIYMPVNRKHLPMSAAGDELDAIRYEKLVKSGLNSVHVTSDQIRNFYAFAGKKLRTLQKGEGLSETERKERMSSAIRDLLTSVFNDSSSGATVERGRGLITDCQEIVKSFITEGADENTWYEKMLQVAGAESGTYNHSGNVATFAALFSLAVNIGKPEDVALAGLLHDLGMADLPAEVQAKEAEMRSPAEETLYRKHVDHTLDIIRFRKMILPDSVLKAIAQHHERWSGTGYPKGYAGTRISPEAQILSLADRFDYLTTTRDGRPRTTPAAAFSAIYRECLDHPATTAFDLELLKRFLVLFPEEAT